MKAAQVLVLRANPKITFFLNPDFSSYAKCTQLFEVLFICWRDE